MNHSISLLLAILAGAVISVQIVVEAKSRAVYGTIPLAVMAFSTALIACLIWAWWTGTNPFPSIHQVSKIGLLQNLGGLARVLYLVCIISAIPVIGTTKTCCIAVTSQLIIAVIIEHYGLFEQPIYRIDWQRIIGGLLLIVGAFMVIFKKCS